MSPPDWDKGNEGRFKRGPSKLSLDQAGLIGQEPIEGLDAVIETFQMDDVLLPGEAAPAEPVEAKEVWDDRGLPPSAAMSQLGRFASNVSLQQKRHQIRHLTAKALSETVDEAKTPPIAVPRTLQRMDDDALADRLSGFAERVAHRGHGAKLAKLAGESAKQFILDQLNPAVQITLALTGGAKHIHALRGWETLDKRDRLLHVAGLTECVSELLSAVTPPPAGPAIKVFGLGMMLVQVAVEKGQPVKERPAASAAPSAPPPESAPPSEPPARGTRMLNAQPPAKRGTGMLAKPPAQRGTGPLTPPGAPRPVRGTGPLAPPTPAKAAAPPPQEDGADKKGQLSDLLGALKRWWI